MEPQPRAEAETDTEAQTQAQAQAQTQTQTQTQTQRAEPARQEPGDPSLQSAVQATKVSTPGSIDGVY